MQKIYSILLCATLVACSRPAPAPQDKVAQVPAATETPQPAGNAIEPGLKELTAEQISTPEASGACNLEKIGDIVVPDAKPIAVPARVFAVNGWLVDDVAKSAPEKLFVRLSSKGGDGKVWEQQVSQTLERPDVQQANGGAAELLKTGFSGEIDASSLPAGEYGALLSYRRGQQVVVCDNGRSIALN